MIVATMFRCSCFTSLRGKETDRRWAVGAGLDEGRHLGKFGEELLDLAARVACGLGGGWTV